MLPPRSSASELIGRRPGGAAIGLAILVAVHEEAQADDGVGDDEHEALQPVGLAVLDEEGDEHDLVRVRVRVRVRARARVRVRVRVRMRVRVRIRVRVRVRVRVLRLVARVH